MNRREFIRTIDYAGATVLFSASAASAVPQGRSAPDNSPVNKSSGDPLLFWASPML